MNPSLFFAMAATESGGSYGKFVFERRRRLQLTKGTEPVSSRFTAPFDT